MTDEQPSPTLKPEADYQVLARKYRPQTFADVLGQEAIVTTLKNGIKHNRLAHAYLFCGSRGTGKTTLARILAKALNCSHKDAHGEPCGTCDSCKEIAAGNSLEVLEIDGASHRGIDDVRQINETVTYAAGPGKYKIYIIDEVHMLTKEAFNALLKTLEEPPPKVKFFFATTEPHKVPATILSRCQRFNLNRIPLEKIVEKLSFMVRAQNVAIDDAALALIAHRADGGFRDAESLLDQVIAFHEGVITLDSIAEVLGMLPREIFFQLDSASKRGDLTFAFEISHRIFSEGKDIYHFVELLIEHFRNLLLLKLGGSEAPFVELSAEDRKKAVESAKLYSQEQCMTIIDLLLDAQSKIRFTPAPRIALEALLLKILKIHQRIPIDYLVRRLAELEENIAKWGFNASIDAPSTAVEMPEPPAQENKVAHKEECQQTVLKTPLPPASVEDPPPASPTPERSKTASQAAVSMPEAGETPPQKEELPHTKEMPPPPPEEIAKPTAHIPSPEILAEQQKAAKKKQSRYDTILQFAAIELEGSLQKRPIRGH